MIFLIKMKSSYNSKKIPFNLLFSFTAIFFLNGCQNAYFSSAKVYLSEENIPKATLFLEKEVTKNPQNVEAHYLLGYCYGLNGKYKEMKQCFNSSLAISEKYKRDINNVRSKFWIFTFNLGRNALQNYQFNEAAIYFKQAIMIDSTNADAYKNLAYIQSQLKNIEAAIHQYETALQLEAYNTKTMLTLCKHYCDMKKYEKAIKLLKKVIEMESNNIEAFLYLANSYLNVGNIEQTKEIYKIAIQNFPKVPEIYYNRGIFFYKLKEFELAKKDFEKCCELSPQDFLFNYNLGISNIRVGDNLREYQKQTTKNINVEAIKTKEMKCYTEAVNYLVKSVEIKPQDVRPLYNLSIIYQSLGKKKEAKAAYLKAKSLEKAIILRFAFEQSLLFLNPF